MMRIKKTGNVDFSNILLSCYCVVLWGCVSSSDPLDFVDPGEPEEEVQTSKEASSPFKLDLDRNCGPLSNGESRVGYLKSVVYPPDSCKRASQSCVNGKIVGDSIVYNSCVVIKERKSK